MRPLSSPDKAFAAPKIFHFWGKLAQRFGGNAAIKLEGRLPFFVEKRFRAEDGMVRQGRAAEDDGVGPDKTIFPDLDRLGRLPVRGQVDAVSDELRTKSSQGRKRADADTGGAINQMAAADPG